MSSQTFAQLVDARIAKLEAKERKPRAYMYASDAGGHPFNIYHSMVRTPETNPSDRRGLRVMYMGKRIEDALISLTPEGYLHVVKEQMDHHREELVRRSANGEDSDRMIWEFLTAADHLLELLGDDVVKFQDHQVISRDRCLDIHMKGDLTNRLGIPVEIKSVNDMAMKWRRLADGTYDPQEHHVLQLMCSMHALGSETGEVEYILRNTGEMPYTHTIHYKDWENRFLRWWDDTSEVVISSLGQKEAPVPPDPVVYDPETNKCKSNWQLFWSRYFNLATGIDTQARAEATGKSEWSYRQDFGKNLANRCNTKLKNGSAFEAVLEYAKNEIAQEAQK